MSGFVDAAGACALLGVKKATLYAYVARGLVRTAPGKDARRRTYQLEDLRRLKARHDARAGHGAVAAGALQWGEPVLDSALCRISPAQGPIYRGRVALELAAAGTPLETVAHWLWTGQDGPGAPWTADALGVAVQPLQALLPAGTGVQRVLAVVVQSLGALDPTRFGTTPGVEGPRAGTLLRRMAAAVALHRPAALRASLRAPGMAHALLVALRGPITPPAIAAVNQALVISADHELNASAFAARVAASAGADVYACLSAALAVHMGPRHGGACDQLETLLQAVGTPSRAQSTVEGWLAMGQQLHGFGHPLYPHGDPRAEHLLVLARRLAHRTSRLHVLEAVISAMDRTTRLKPSLDVGLTALCRALELPVGAPTTLFALGRAAGWVAHVMEQRQSPALLRPRARYVGP